MSPNDATSNSEDGARRRRRRRVIGLVVGLALGAALAVGVGAYGVRKTLCVVGLGPCETEVDAARKSELELIVADIAERTDAIWAEIFTERGLVYVPPRIALYNTPLDTDCGLLPAGASPTYCKIDRRVYLDLAFFNLIVERYGAEGNTIPAFVVTHEVSHHVQNLLGEFDRYLGLLRAYEAMSEEERAEVDNPNQLLVRFELQADCFAGVAAARAQARYDLLDDAAIAEAIEGATKLGDDNVQRVESGFINEAAFTHGSGEQRLKWLAVGYETGDIDACDTWAPDYGDL